MCKPKKYEQGVITYKHNSFISRCKHICDSEQISLTRHYIFQHLCKSMQEEKKHYFHKRVICGKYIALHF